MQRVLTRIGALSLAASLAAGGLACTKADEGGTVRDVGTTNGTAAGGGSGSASGPTGTTGTAGTTPGGGGYSPGSDVDAQAEIGDDVAAIKTQLAKAADGPVDWAAVKQSFTEGGASKNGDGSIRTLAKLVDAPDVISVVEAAIAGGDDDKVRAQIVEKGITVLLHLKVIDELDAAAGKVQEGKVAAGDGAPHNVDEAWAFYTAAGNGPQSTAKKRGDDFKKDIDGQILAALTAAQKAAAVKDADAFDKVRAEAEGALNTTFYLATYKYLDTGGDAVKRAEGETFFLALKGRLTIAVPDAVTAITAAFESGKADEGRVALNRTEVLTALGIQSANKV